MIVLFNEDVSFLLLFFSSFLTSLLTYRENGFIAGDDNADNF